MKPLHLPVDYHPYQSIRIGGHAPLLIDKGEAMVCRATPTVNDVLIINGLDLRPLGLDIYSDAQGLHIMGSTMTKNMTSGVPVVMDVP